MEYKHKIGKHEFRFYCNKERILEQIKEERNRYEENCYQYYYTVGSEDGYLTKEQYNENLDIIENKLEELLKPTKIIEIIESAKKKKNGTLYKNRKAYEYGCNNTVFITEWHNTWIYNALKIKSESDLFLRLTYVEVTDTPA